MRYEPHKEHKCACIRDQSVNVVHEKPKLTVRISQNTRIHYIDIILTRLKASQTGAQNQVWKEVYLFSKTSRTALESTRSPIQLVSGTLSLTVEGPRCDANHSLPSHAEVRIMCFHDLYMASSHLSGQNLKSVVENMAADTVTSVSSRGK
jgi:hypothetical protein